LLAAYLSGEAHRALVTSTLAHLPQAHPGVCMALCRAGASLALAAAPAQSLACACVAERCCEVLRQLKGITATYRMTNKAAPTRHSHFVPGVTQPLRAFLDAPRQACLGAEARDRVASAVAALVTQRYEELARELVTTVRKTESSLKRLKDRRGAGGAPGAAGAPQPGAASSELSDTDKICRQLLLDAQEYGRQLSRFGVDAAQEPSFRALWEVVASDGEPLSLAAP
jgi:hypothetical protein